MLCRFANESREGGLEAPSIQRPGEGRVFPCPPGSEKGREKMERPEISLRTFLQRIVERGKTHIVLPHLPHAPYQLLQARCRLARRALQNGAEDLECRRKPPGVHAEVVQGTGI